MRRDRSQKMHGLHVCHVVWLAFREGYLLDCLVETVVMVVGEEKMRPAKYSGSHGGISAIGVSLRKKNHLAMAQHPCVPAIACGLIAVDSRWKTRQVMLVAGARG